MVCLGFKTAAANRRRWNHRAMAAVPVILTYVSIRSKLIWSPPPLRLIWMIFMIFCSWNQSVRRIIEGPIWFCVEFFTYLVGHNCSSCKECNLFKLKRVTFYKIGPSPFIPSFLVFSKQSFQLLQYMVSGFKLTTFWAYLWLFFGFLNTNTIFQQTLFGTGTQTPNLLDLGLFHLPFDQKMHVHLTHYKNPFETK